MTPATTRDGTSHGDGTIVGVFGIIVLASGLGNKNGAFKSTSAKLLRKREISSLSHY